MNFDKIWIITLALASVFKSFLKFEQSKNLNKDYLILFTRKILSSGHELLFLFLLIGFSQTDVLDISNHKFCQIK